MKVVDQASHIERHKSIHPNAQEEPKNIEEAKKLVRECQGKYEAKLCI